MALDPVLAAGVAPPKFASPLDIYGKMVDIRKGQYENDIYESKLADLKRDREALATLQAQIDKAGGPDNLPEAAKAMIASGIPHFMDFGFKINEKLNFQKQFNDLMNPPAASSQEPQQPAKPPVAFTSPIDRPIDEQQPPRFSVSEGIAQNKLAPMVSAAAPAVGAPVNNLLPSNFTRNVDAQIAELERKRSGMSLLAGQDPRLMPLVAEFSRQISELKKPQTFSPGQIVSVPGQPNIQIPFAPTTSQQEFNLAQQNPDYLQYLKDRAAAIRPPPVPVQPVAPTVTEIQDPTDPTRTISVDARKYQGGGVGSPGVIGVGKKSTETLKPVPQTVNSALIGNTSSVEQIDKAIDAVKRNPSAVGLKGNLPQTILNRTDPSGVEARALVTDVGSAKVHDRSGAAVAASEAPRLMPFIPQATDDAATVIKKLTQLKQQIQTEQSNILDFYSEDQGYKPTLYHKKAGISSTAKPISSGGVDTNNPLLKLK